MLNDGIGSIKSIGPKREKCFNKMGIYTVGDILGLYPRAYEDRTKLKKICELKDGEKALIKACAVTVVKNSRVRRGLSLQKVKVADGTGILEITWFNQDWLARSFDISAEYFCFGAVKIKGNTVTMANPVCDLAKDAKQTGKIVPIYPLTAGLTQSVVGSVVAECLKDKENFAETLPAFLREKYALCAKDYALLNIHFPKDAGSYSHARRRLAFEELFYLQLAMRLSRGKISKKKGVFINADKYADEFAASLPFELTADQIRVIGEICGDMKKGTPMNRLVQGDVGCGKTAVAAAAIFAVVKNGYQAAMMAPTEILANQHIESVGGMLAPFGVRCVILKGSMTAKQKREVYEKISSGEADLVIGTHALIQKDVNFKNLALVVTDEQHRFGVRQRSMLSEKSDNPHTLVMTATPIPRTLALILYGDLEISSIRTLPPGRKKVATYSVGEDMRERINKFMLKQISEGRQVYIVCPAVEATDAAEELKAVTEYAGVLQSGVFSKHTVAVVHGKLSASEKERIMSDFYFGKTDVLVSTTVIEVGVNVPNANTIVIENAERFGLSQLHQLRGRVGRGKYSSYCIMFCNAKSDTAKERMNIMTKTNDGFEISEKDLTLRGPGEFFGTCQHGLPEFKVANMYKDSEIMSAAGEAADCVTENIDNVTPDDKKMINTVLFKQYGDFGILN